MQCQCCAKLAFNILGDMQKDACLNHCKTALLAPTGCLIGAQIVDGSSRGVIEVERENLPDAVVWNPWIDKAAGMADFGDEEYQACPHLHPCSSRCERVCVNWAEDMPSTRLHVTYSAFYGSSVDSCLHVKRTFLVLAGMRECRVMRNHLLEASGDECQD